MTGEHYDREAILIEDRETRRKIWQGLENSSCPSTSYIGREEADRDYREAPGYDCLSPYQEYLAWSMKR